MVMFIFHFSRILCYQVEKREQEDPYKVDKMPVKPGVFVYNEIIVLHLIPYYVYKYKANESQPDYNVKGMHARHEIIQPVKHYITIASLPQDFRSGVNSFPDMVPPFKIFIHEENQSCHDGN